MSNTTTESVAGARLALGVNWFVASHFMLDIEGDYHAVGHFEQAMTSKPSGFGMSFGFGFTWGGR